MYMHYSSPLQKLRKERGLTQQQVADFLHMDRSTYAYHEGGRTRANIDVLVELAHLYRVNLDDLLGEHALETAPRDSMGAAGHAEAEPIDAAIPLFSQLSREEQQIVILYRSGATAQREALLAQAAIQVSRA
jgi:transcriptional regulator with XRE-family HTH domain